MRALSIRQPYAELILRGIKTVEYRTRPTRIIGERFHIYASKAKAASPIWSDHSFDGIGSSNSKFANEFFNSATTASSPRMRAGAHRLSATAARTQSPRRATSTPTPALSAPQARGPGPP
jgi:ASCH domain